jgi:hypothetical protein
MGKYPRPAFKQAGFPTVTQNYKFGDVYIEVPKFDTPISPRENFIRTAKRDKPLWTPNHITDVQSLETNELAVHKKGKYQLGPDFRLASRTDLVFLDPYGNSWSWQAAAQGAMLTPGTRVLDDICDWERDIKWPDLDEWTFRENADRFMNEIYSPDKAMHVNIFQGLTEMLVAFMGGYGEGMIAMIDEPEAVSALFDRFADHMIAFFDLMKSLYPLDYVTYHDDWGTERDTFFSPQMFEELVYKPTKRITDHVKNAGVFFELHSCGKIERFMPYICDLGVDFLQIQRRAVDIPKMKEIYGDRVGFNPVIENHVPGADYTDDEIIRMVRDGIDLYAKGGGYYPWIFETRPRELWTLCSELYCYSREYFDAD